VLLLMVVSSCAQPMTNQPKYGPLQPSSFFPDGRSARPVPSGTVARGRLGDDERFYTGKTNGELVTTLPVPLTRKLLERGRERFNIYCAPCHGETGDGQGIVVLRGFRRGPPSYHIDRLREAPVGYFFDVVTNGFGGMQDYAAQISPHDRWAIVAYLRTLQLSQRTKIDDVPAAERDRLETQR
jgi:Cytochrome C oxidase, cbb3-type, subunit III